MRTANTWNVTTVTTLRSLTTDRGLEQVADDLGVSIDTIRTWTSGRRAPNRRFQMAIEALATDFKNISPSSLGDMLTDFLEIQGQDVEFLAGQLGVSERTAQAYVNGDRVPRARRRLASLLSTPTPA